MRVSAAVASCIGAGLVLQGCGGGEQKATCLADNMDVVSQSMSGKLKIDGHVDFNGTKTPIPQTTIHFKQKFDLEKFNMREDVSDGETKNGTVIINVEKKHVITYTSVVTDGTTVEECKIAEFKDLPALPPPLPPLSELTVEQLAMTMNLVVKPLLKKANCSGSDGTYDTWEVSHAYTGPLPEMIINEIPDTPLGNLDGLSIKDGSVSEHLQMTKDHLLHSSTTYVTGEMLNGTAPFGSLTMNASLTVDEATKGGPSEADLDPSQFPNCTKANTTIDMQDFLLSPGFARQQLLRQQHVLVVV